MKQAWIEKTEQYFDNEMSATERSLFEQEMAANEELYTYVSLYREIEAVMHDDEKNDAAAQALKSSLGKLNAFYFDKKIKEHTDVQQDLNEIPVIEPNTTIAGGRTKQKARLWVPLAAAAAIIGLIAIAIIWFSQNQQTKPSIAVSEKQDTSKKEPGSLQGSDSSGLATLNNIDSMAKTKQPAVKASKKQEELFAGNFEPDAVPAVTEGPLEDAFTYYSDKKYADAAQEFTSADLKSGTRGPEANPKLTAFYADYYAGISYLEQADTTNAIRKLESAVTKGRGEPFDIKAEWYLALAYLKTGDLTKANEMLIKVSENKKETVYKSKAARLLTALK